jgi:hypothetical protein
LSFENEDRAEIIDVGQCRAGNHLIAQRLEKTVRIVVRQVFLRADGQLRRALVRVGRNNGAGVS